MPTGALLRPEEPSGEASPKRVGRDEVGERGVAVDLDHRQPRAIPGLELGVARDVHERELECGFAADTLHDLDRALAEVAAGRVVDGDAAQWSYG